MRRNNRKHKKNVQGCKSGLAGLIEETPKHYDNLQDIEAAAQGGKVISLFNLSQLVNHV